MSELSMEEAELLSIFKKNVEYFHSNYDTLQRLYQEGEFVAIMDEQPTDHDMDLHKLLARIETAYGRKGAIHIGQMIDKNYSYMI